MTARARQNTLFVSEDQIRIYEAIQNVDFRAYDFDNLVAALVNHLRDNFPEEFNDWISSSEFIMKVEVLAGFHKTQHFVQTSIQERTFQPRQNVGIRL